MAKVFFCGANQDNCPPTTDQTRRQMIIAAGQAAKQAKLGIYGQQCLATANTSTVKITNSKTKATTSTNKLTTNPSTQTSTSTKVIVNRYTTTSQTTVSSSTSITSTTNSSSVKSKATSTTISQPAITDTAPPDTTIKTTLPAITNTGTANFILSSTEPGKFECRLNDQKWKKCVADYQLKNLVSGHYQLAVRAIDLAGNIDPTPATYNWTIDKKKTNY